MAERQHWAKSKDIEDERPLELTELVPLEELQRMQDSFAFATGVAALITGLDGRPITQPSNFTRLCAHVIRATEKGRLNCIRSDALLGKTNPKGPNVQPCLSCGLWDAGASIYAGSRHIANWLIGQVRNEAQDEATMLAYAQDIGADEAVFRKALNEVPRMSQEQFQHVSEFLFLMANQISQLAYTNLAQKRTFAEQKEQEVLQRELQEKAYRSQKLEAIGQLAGGVAHDFNNLLTALLGNAEILAQSLQARKDNDALALLGEITASAERAARLTRQLLTFSRQQPQATTKVDVIRQLQELLPILRRLLPENVQVATAFPPGAYYVLAEPTQLDQIVLNLAVNARDALVQGGAIELAATPIDVDGFLAAAHPGLEIGPHILITVADNGSGMSEEVLEHIFEPFFSTKAPHRGTGLGLSTVYGIVRQMKGAVTADSEVGRGTFFSVYLPLMPTSHRENAATTTAPLRGGHETILLCEDDEALRVLLARVLREAGYAVVVTESGEAARRAFLADIINISLLLTDVVLPQMSGRELAEELQRLAPDFRVLFMSGYTGQVFGDTASIERGINLLEKPFTRDALLRRVRATLDEPMTPIPNATP